MTTTSTRSRKLPADIDPAWLEAERHIIEQVASLTRWQAEKWSASHERQLPRISLMALRVSYMQAAMESDKTGYLDQAFKRLEKAVRSTDWADTSDADGELRLAVGETVTAVIEMAQHALAAVVLAEEADDDRLPAQRQRQLALAGTKMDELQP